jgi:hypothetical protein
MRIGVARTLVLWCALTASAAHGQVFVQDAGLLAPDVLVGDRYAFDGALSGDVAAIGSPRDVPTPGVPGNTLIGEGSVYLFERDAGVWNLWGKVTAPVGNAGASFGRTVALDGTTLAVGASNYDLYPPYDGAVFVFERTRAGWTLDTVLTHSPTPVLGQFGFEVALLGDTLLVGDPWGQTGSSTTHAGRVFVFERQNGVWSEKQMLTSTVAQDGDLFGWSLALSSSRALIGAPYHKQVNQRLGAAFVFEPVAGLFTELAMLRHPAPKKDDFFGGAVALSKTSNRMLVGARHDDEDGKTNVGSGHIFEHAGGASWTHVAQLDPIDTEFHKALGCSVGFFDETPLPASKHDTIASPSFGSGAIYVFEESGAAWAQRTKLVPQGPFKAGFGEFVSVSGRELLTGSNGWSSVSGSAWILSPCDDCSPPVSYCTAGTSSSGCRATIQVSGRARANSHKGCMVWGLTAEGNEDGVLFYGASGRQARPWGNGSSTLCVAPPLHRSPVLFGGGSSGNCESAYLIDLNAEWSTPPSKSPNAGTSVQLQFWYRDPNSTSNVASNLSDAIELIVAP